MKDKKIKGYKAFNSNMTNNYGVSFEEGCKYSVSGPAVYGNDGNGFHFCERLEDTLRYFDAMNGDIKIAEVIGSGDIEEYCDEYYGYYNMYSATNLEVVRILPRNEIVDMFAVTPGYRTVRFIQGFKLLEQEVLWYKYKRIDDSDVLKAIAYYQEGDEKAYSPEKAYEYMQNNRFHLLHNENKGT